MARIRLKSAVVDILAVSKRRRRERPAVKCDETCSEYSGGKQGRCRGLCSVFSVTNL